MSARTLISVEDYLASAYEPAADGLSEVKNGVLRTADPIVEVPLNEIFR